MKVQKGELYGLELLVCLIDQGINAWTTKDVTWLYTVHTIVVSGFSQIAFMHCQH